LKAYWTVAGSGNGDGFTATAKIHDVYCDITAELDWTNEPDYSHSVIDGLDTLYVGADGFTCGFNGGSGIAQYPHDIHRDMMYRYAGFDYADSAFVDWSAIDTARSVANWKCRYWLLEETPLIEILNKLQYEGGFTFKPTVSGGKYIYVKNSYSSSDAAQSLTEEDYNNLSVRVTSFRDAITKTTYNYNKHAAENKYTEAATLTNSTLRTAYNIGGLENTSIVNLDCIIGDADGGTNPNDSIARYYDNINADLKLEASFDLVNFSMMNIEIGDIIIIIDAYLIPFNKDWESMYFMVVETRRKLNSLHVVAREVYT
jgi:hypothetical protein